MELVAFKADTPTTCCVTLAKSHHSPKSHHSQEPQFPTPKCQGRESKSSAW